MANEIKWHDSTIGLPKPGIAVIGRTGLDDISVMSIRTRREYDVVSTEWIEIQQFRTRAEWVNMPAYWKPF